MSTTRNSTIKSSLFMIDPVNGNNAGKSKQFYTKGSGLDSDMDTSTSSLIVDVDDNSYQLERNTLNECLAELKTHGNTQVKNLSPASTETFRSIVEALKLLHGSKKHYEIVLKDIHSTFSSFKSVKPGTVAAFFIGCFNDDNFTGPFGCNPKCAASLPPFQNSDGTTDSNSNSSDGYATCDDLVLIYTNNNFSSLNEKRSSHAYIYVDDNKFKGFSKDNIKTLKETNIKTASLIFGNEDGSYKEVSNPLSLVKLPIVGKKSSWNSTSSSFTGDSSSNSSGLTSDTSSGSGCSSGSSSSDDEPTSTSNSGAWIILAIAVVLILLLFILYKNSAYV